MATDSIGLTTILAGRTSNLTPLLYLTGGVQPGKSPYPSLNLSYDIHPHGEHESRWANASLDEINHSFELAKEVINKNWDAEFARIQRINSQQIEITTGNQDWNTAFYLTQTIASQLILQPSEMSRSPSFVYIRNPDQGFSLRKDGSDYNHLWNGQTAFDAYYLTNFLLPAYPEILKGILDNFLGAQTHGGEVDWKVGLGGQRSQLLSTPLIANLAWLYYESSHNTSYIQTIYPKLLQFFYSWFTSSHDRDNDSIPEWDQTIQTGFEEHPLFSHTYPWSMGMDITTVESPDLIAYLFKESRSLISIAKLLGDETAIHQLEPIADQLKKMVDQSWNDLHASYHYRDRDSHLSPKGEILGTLKGSGEIEIHREFQQPIRPILVIKSKTERTQPVQIYIHGITPKGAHRVDSISSRSIRWHQGSGYITSEYIYKSMEQIEITGIPEDVEVIAQSADLTGIDQSLLLPLWAKIPDEDKAKVLINLTILNNKMFLSPYGLRSSVDGLRETDISDEYYAMHLPWISLILEGLCHYGMYRQAAEVFTRLMKAVLHSLKTDMKFHQSYQSETGKPLGDVNSLVSLIPIGLFLRILGVRIISPSHVEITGGNPFPWPVTIKYRGLTVVQQEKKALIIFPDGQNFTIQNDRPQAICVTKS